MTKYDYLTMLKQHLSPLPPKERVNAVNYYDRYFTDAGTENEQRVMSRLGTPKELAERIIKSSKNTFPGMVNETKSTVRAAAKRPKTQKPRRSFFKSLLMFLTSAVIVIVLVLVLALFAVAVAGAVAAAFVFGAALLAMSVPYIFKLPSVGLTAMGLALVIIGISVLVFVPLMNFVFFIIKRSVTGVMGALNGRLRGKAAGK